MEFLVVCGGSPWMQSVRCWAQDEFSDVDLGDVRRNRRLVAVAASFAANPAGKITCVVQGADREAAFRFVENDAVDPSLVARSTHAATARRCAVEAEVIVPVDQTSLTLTDRVGKRGFGRTGTTTESRTTAGFQVMTALAVSACGVTLGIVGQQWWARHELSPERHHDKRSDQERESDLWRRTLVQACEAIGEHAPRSKPWFQLDRGADCRAVIELAVEQQLRVTVRSAYSRTLSNGLPLHDWMRSRPVVGRYELLVPSRWQRDARLAELVVRVSAVSLKLSTRSGRTRIVALHCVHVREQRCPKQGPRLEWFLLTTVPTANLRSAMRVISNYAVRWRVEEFHRAWKSGVCNIEDSQLRSDVAFMRWATIGAAVAARAERLKLQSRSTPDAPAAAEFTPAEIDAAIILSKTKKHVLGDELTLEQIVGLVAHIGGYIGKSSGGPPGVRVIQRGLDRVLAGAAAIGAIRGSG